VFPAIGGLSGALFAGLPWTLFWSLVVATAYYAGGKVGLSMFPFEKNVAVLWPSPALALAALLLLGARMIPAIFVGCLVISATLAPSFADALGGAASSTLYCTAAWWLLTRIAPIDAGLRRVQDVVRFIVFGVVVVALLKGVLAGLVLAANEGVIPDERMRLVVVSALAAGVGILVITPAILTLVALRAEPFFGDRPVERTLLFASGLAIAVGVFFLELTPRPFAMHIPYLLFPVIFWAGVRFGPREAALILLLSASIAITCTTAGSGPFASAEPIDALASMYLFVFVLATTGFMFAAGLRQRADADRVARVAAERFRLLIDRMNEGFVTLDRDGRITYASDRFSELAGMQRDVLLGTPFTALLATDSRRPHPAGTSNPPEEAVLARPDGRQVHVEVSSRLLAPGEAGNLEGSSFAVVTDITARHAAETALRESESKFRLLVENQNDLVLRIDRSGAVAFASPSSAHVLGQSAESLLGRPLTLWVHEEDQASTQLAWASAWSPPCHARFENRVCTHAGWRWLAWSVSAIPGDVAEGAACAVVATARDITDRRRAEEQSRQHLQQLAHVARVSSMGEMASAIAHEINQPLTAITSYSDACVRMLRANTADPDELLQAMERVAAQAQRAGDVVRRMRSFVRGDEGEIHPVQVNFLVREVHRLAAPEARQGGVTLEVATDDAAGEVLADSIQVQQVLLNLVRNAIEAVGMVERPDRLVRVATQVTDDGQVVIVVEDNGPGLPVEHRARIFEPFFTTKADGMGIGLALSRSIVDAHGGRIHAEDAPGGGARFRVVLPACSDVPED